MPDTHDGTSSTPSSSDAPSLAANTTSDPTMSPTNTPTSSTTTSPSLPTTSSTLQRQILLDPTRRKFLKRYRTEISASTASLASTLTAYPLDSVKTRMQAYKFPNFLDCVRHTYRTEGVHGFWRGVLAPLASITLVRTVSFSIYQKAKYTYDDAIRRATGRSPLVHANTRGAWPSVGTVACFGAAGATSGALITFISCPFELTKLNAQIAVLMEKGVDPANSSGGGGNGGKKGQETQKGGTQTQQQKPKNMGTLGTVRTIVRHRGMMGLYSGFHLHLLRDTIGTAIYFTTYESCKQILANARGNSPTSPLAVVLAGGLCGLVSWACIYPIDSAKSIYQRNVLSAGGARAPGSGAGPGGGDGGPSKVKRAKIEFFSRKRYRGLGVSMSRSCLVNAIFFSVFEGMKKMVNRLDEGEEGDGGD